MPKLSLWKLGYAIGYEKLRLETGVKQPAAIHLYESSGYKQIPCYGPHLEDPDSICFEKSI